MKNGSRLYFGDSRAKKWLLISAFSKQLCGTGSPVSSLGFSELSLLRLTSEKKDRNKEPVSRRSVCRVGDRHLNTKEVTKTEDRKVFRDDESS